MYSIDIPMKSRYVYPRKIRCFTPVKAVPSMQVGQGRHARSRSLPGKLSVAASSVDAPGIELDDGKIWRKDLYLMVKTMVSCRFSLKPIH